MRNNRKKKSKRLKAAAANAPIIPIDPVLSMVKIPATPSYTVHLGDALPSPSVPTRTIIADKRLEPLFLICYHRSGSTYLMRLLNSSDNLAVYGEHDGIFNHLREMSNKMYARFGDIERKSVGVKVETLHGQVQTSWIPYANPFTYASFINATRQYVLDLFAKELPINMRWGFKEIRYRTIDTVIFMSHLFPRAKFVFLHREATDLLASNVRAPWVINPKMKAHNGNVTLQALRKQVANTMKHIIEFHEMVDHCNTVLRPSSMVMYYEHLCAQPEAEIRRILDFVGEPQDSLNLTRLAAANETEVGTEVKLDRYQKMFDRKNLRRMAGNFVEAQQRGLEDEWVRRGKTW